MTAFPKQSAGLKPEQIIEIIFNRRWFIIIPVCISLTVGLIFTITSKKIYQASTTILIQPQKVPEQYIQSIVSTDLNQRLSTIAQQILSRSNLEKIIEQFGLFEDEKNMYLEDKVANLRKRIEVKIETNRKADADAFSVLFTDSNPERVMKIANTLATYFMDENLKVREIQALGTSEFLDSELNKLKARLEEKEEALSKYRTEYMGGLPDELESNLRTLDRLQQQLTDRQNALRDVKTAISVVTSQISRTKQLQEESSEGIFSVDDKGTVKDFKSETEKLLYTEKAKLDELLLKYTANHPEVMKLTKSVEKLKEKLELEAKDNKQDISSANTEKTNKTPISMADAKSNDALFNREIQNRQLNNEIIKLESDIAEIKNSMIFYQKRVEETPKREQELRSLERDYNNIRENYNSLLDRQLEAEIAVNMEKKQKGEQFRILDYAKIPEKPISPDVRRLFVFSIGIGFGLGGGLIFLLEFLDKSIRRPEEIETEFGLPILASIPSLKIDENKTKKRIELALFSLFSFYALSILSVFAVINYKGLDKTVNFIKTQFNF